MVLDFYEIKFIYVGICVWAFVCEHLYVGICVCVHMCTEAWLWRSEDKLQLRSSGRSPPPPTEPKTLEDTGMVGAASLSEHLLRHTSL